MAPLPPSSIQELTRLRRAVEASGEVIFMTDRDGTLTYVNPAFVHLYGYAAEEVVGRVTPRILKSGVVPPEQYAALWQALLKKQAVAGVVVNRTKEGKLIEVESSVNPIVDDDGGMLGFVAVQRDITDRRRAEEGLRKREAEHNEAQRVAGVGSWEWAIGSGTITWSEGLYRILGLDLSHPAPTFQTLASFYLPESWARLQLAVQRALDGDPYELDLQMVRGDGASVWTTTRGEAVRDVSGKVVALRGTVLDIHARKAADEALRSSEERFRALTDSANDAIVIADGHGKIVLWSRGAERLFLYSPEEAEGQPVGLLIPEPYHQQHVEAVQRMHATGESRVEGRTYEAVGMRKDGSHVPVDISLAMWEGADGRFAGAIIRDVSERKRAEEAIRRREADLREAQRVAQVGSWEWEVATDTVTWSEELYRILRMDPTQPAPGFAELERFYTPESWALLQSVVARAVQAGIPYEVDLTEIRNDGVHVRTSTRGEVVRDATGAVVGLRGTVLDITERKRAEESLRRSEDRLRQAQKMEAVGQLAGGVAHDFNNLLTVILGNASLLMEAPQVPSEVERRARTVVESAERGANLTRQLLAFSRRQVIQVERLALNDIIAHLLKMLGRLLGENITIRCEYAPALPPIDADAGMVEQVIMNLAVNARDALPNGGTLSLVTRAANVDAGAAARNPDARVGRFVALEVTDSGTGMDPATVSHIFEPFFTTKDVGKGTGLGLATVHGIVSQHQGWIEVASEPGRGSTFTVFLPAAADDHIDAPARATHDLAGGHGTILVVEDEAEVRSLAVACLQRSGYHVLEAATGVEALRLWGDHAGRIDLLLTDMVMPEAITGRELAARFRERRPDLKVIFSSGYSRDVLTAEPDWSAADTFLPKPYTPSALTQAVRRRLDAA